MLSIKKNFKLSLYFFYSILLVVFFLISIAPHQVAAQSQVGGSSAVYNFPSGINNSFQSYDSIYTSPTYECNYGAPTTEANTFWLSPTGQSTTNINNSSINLPRGQSYSFQLNTGTVFCFATDANTGSKITYPISTEINSQNLNPYSYLLAPHKQGPNPNMSTVFNVVGVSASSGSVSGLPQTTLYYGTNGPAHTIPNSIYFASSGSMTFNSSTVPSYVTSVNVSVTFDPYNTFYNKPSSCVGPCTQTLNFTINFLSLPSPILPPPVGGGGGNGAFTASCNGRAGPVSGILNYTFPSLPGGAYNPTYSVVVNKYYQGQIVGSYYQSYPYNPITFVTPYTLHSQNPPPGNYYYIATTNYNYWFNQTYYYWYHNSTGWHLGQYTIPVQEFGSSNTINSNSTTCDYKPYFHVRSGDIVAGSTRQSLGCSGSANISGYSADTTSSGSKYAAIATGTISNFVSGQGLYGSLTSPSSPLTFSNTSGNNGNFGTAPCLTNYFQPPSSSSGNNYVTTSNPNLPYSISPGEHYTYYVNGNVIINHNITFSAVSISNPAQIPSFNLIVNGNIYIDSNVTQLDGLYQALGTGSNGNIYDCYPFNAANYSSCSQQLIINGSMMAQNTFHLDRTTSGLITPPYPGFPGPPAEIFNLSPLTWFDQINNNSNGTPPYNENNNQLQYASLTSLPPIY
jgi:hypothetical protein